MNTPRLFNDKGKLMDVDVSGFDAATLTRFRAVRAAYQAHTDAQDALTAAYAEVNAALRAVENTEAYCDAHYPRQTFQDLWNENFGGGPHNIMRSMGLR